MILTPLVVRKKYPNFEIEECMDFQRLGITGIANRALDGLEKLQELWLNNNKISNIANRDFKGLKNLQELYLEENKITNEQKEELTKALPNVNIYF